MISLKKTGFIDSRGKEMEEKIRKYIDDLAADKGVELEKKTDLFETGVLDSMGFIMLLSFIQDEFGIEFSEEDMNAEKFTTFDSIVGFLQEKIDR